MKTNLTDSVIKKTLLAFTDAFIVISSALVTNYLFSFFNPILSSSEMLTPIILGSFCCVMFLYIFGAYSKLWRYSRKRDYICCLPGVFFGIGAMWIFHLISAGKPLSPAFTIAHCAISAVGIFTARIIIHKILSSTTKSRAQELTARKQRAKDSRELRKKEQSARLLLPSVKKSPSVSSLLSSSLQPPRLSKSSLPTV